MPRKRQVILPGISYGESPNHSGRGGAEPEVVIMHYTAAGSAKATASWMASPASRVSSHFIVGRHGWVGQIVPLDKKAWHAGVSEWVKPSTGELTPNVNDFSIGIELANWGMLHRDDAGVFWCELGGTLQRYQGPEPVFAILRYDNLRALPGWWEPYPQTQIDALRDLISALAREGWPVSEIAGHEEIAMPFATRKRDPGPLFPWASFGRIRATRRTSAIYHAPTATP